MKIYTKRGDLRFEVMPTAEEHFIAIRLNDPEGYTMGVLSLENLQDLKSVVDGLVKAYNPPKENE